MDVRSPGQRSAGEERRRLGESIGVVADTPVVTDERCYVATDHGVAALSLDGDVRWSRDVRGEFETDRWDLDDDYRSASSSWTVHAPVVGDGTVYVGTTRWQELGSGGTPSPTLTPTKTPQDERAPGLRLLVGAGGLAGAAAWLAQQYRRED